MSWYYADNGDKKGPVSEPEWKRLTASGRIRPDTLVWQDGMADWVPFSQIAGAAAPSPVAMETAPSQTAGAACSECGNTFPPEDLVTIEGRPVCSACKPIVVQKLKEGSLPSGLMNYAGFWIRGGAKIIDGIILYVVNMALGFAFMSLASGDPNTNSIMTLVLFGVQMAISLGYSVWFLGKFGATPGKMACGLRVVRSDGSQVTYGRAFGRFFAEIVSAMIIYIGYIMAAFDDEKRALHDRICDTRVIRGK